MMTLLHLGNGAAAVSSCKSQEKPARGRTCPFKKHLQDSLPVSSEDTQPGPRSREGFSQHQHSTLLTPTGLILLQALRAEQSCCITGKHHPDLRIPWQLGSDWEGTGSHSHGLRTLQNNPLMAKLPNKRALI